MRFAALILSLALVAGCATTVRVPEAPAVEPEAAAETWARVLDQHVDSLGRVNFQALAEAPADLHIYVSYLARVSPWSQPSLFPDRASELAYHINAYNALAMFNVVEAGVPDSLAGTGKLSFFVLRRVTVGGRELSLYAYENKIIRPLGEERIHFALNCMVVACPRLPRKPFQADLLDTQLERETRRFFNESRNLQVDAGERRVRLSEIMKFYTEDFTDRAPSLVAYANRYVEPDIPEDYRVEFIPYDWTVNRQDRIVKKRN
ncbi:MAG: DUF547 domain-containing protein [Gammaproteobacteria bacterium]|nr:DUF547 domain-containing protein [Gammaproteobacteria bacterium]